MLPLNIKNRTIISLANSLLSIFPKKTKTLTRKHVCKLMFIAPLFTISKIWKQPKCPLIDEWIKIKRYIQPHTHTHIHTHTHTHTHTEEYYSVIKNNEILPFAITWMKLESIMLGEISQRKTNII